MPVDSTPRASRAAAGLAAVLLGLGAASSANESPAVVFKTRPRAVDGVISGRGPLDVTFNMCPTSDADPGDRLKFTYDFDGNGSIDYYGHCRQAHRYPASDQCLDATVCASDRQPGHRVCRTYTVCASGGNGEAGPSTSPSPSPSPSVSPDILPFTYDLYSFTGAPGTTVDVSVDTISAGTAFDAWACISKTREGCVLFDENVVDWGDDDKACTFPPPNYECPSFSATLPPDDDGVYYLLVSDAAEDDFSGAIGMYSLQVNSDVPIGPLQPEGDNVPDDKIAAANALPEDAPPVEELVASAPMALPARPAPVRPGPVRPTPPAPSGGRAGAAAPVRPQGAARPALPDATADPGTPPAVVAGAGRQDPVGGRPEASFRTEPRASSRGRITGGSSFDVTFDLCASKGPDPARELIFRFDLDGDGVTDDSGSCRQTRRYEFEESAPCVKSLACVGDGEKHHEACRTYTVCRAERGPGPK